MKKRILIYTTEEENIGGVERYIHDSTMKLKSEGHQIFYFFEKESEKNKIELFGEKVNWDFVQTNEFDEVHIHKVTDNNKLKKVITHNKTIFYGHDHEIYCPKKSKYDYFGNNCTEAFDIEKCKKCTFGLERKNGKIGFINFESFQERLHFIAFCDEFITLSEFMKDNLVQNGIPKNKIIVKPPKKELPIEEIEKAYKSDILFCGQLVKGKGTREFLKIIDKVEKDELKVFVLGTGKDLDLMRSFKHKKKNIKIRYLGKRKDVLKFMRNTKVLAVTSKWQEPFGLVGLEAISQECPIVAFNTGGIREWLKHGENGYLVQDFNINDFAAYINHILRNSLKEEAYV